MSVVYASIGLVLDTSGIVSHLVSGLRSSLLLLGAGCLPLVVLLTLTALVADRLDQSERRLLLLGAGVASLILVPLLSLAF